MKTPVKQPLFSPNRGQSLLALGLLFSLLLLPGSLRGQLTLTDDFNSGTDVPNWVHYMPIATAPWNEQVSWTFPTEGTGKAYRIFGGAPDVAKETVGGNNTGPARVGSLRKTAEATYTDFSMSMDLVNWDDTIFQNMGFAAARITSTGTGFLTTLGYLAGYAPTISPSDEEASFQLIEFQSELMVSYPGSSIGGFALLSHLNPLGKYRMVFSGTGANLQAAIYNRTDLLEPIAKIAANNSDIASGVVGIGAVNYDFDDDKAADYTFDNFYSSPTPTSPVGYPGTPQAINLAPAPQTLFYRPPGLGSNITFNVTTYTVNQINTNSLRVTLNGVQISSGQLVITEVRTPITGSPNTNFAVRYTGSLATNTIYNAQILIQDMSGNGTTNNFVFDTFQTNGIIIVEAEDYNYSNGQFQDSPAVSGLDPSSVQINGGGIGYYGQQGTLNVDYFDYDGSPNANEQQYRSLDGVGTAQYVYTGDTPRPDHVATNVPDYVVWEMLPGEWLNYTRTFPNTNWNVYLRASSQARDDVRLDLVTSDRTQPNQTKVLRGNFLVPNTGSSTRFRYVPLTDAAGNPVVIALSSTNTLRMTQVGGLTKGYLGNEDTGDAGSFQPTYFLFMPTNSAPPQTPWVALASPSAGATGVSVQPTIQITILNRTTSVNCPGSIQLRLDGADVTSSAVISCSTSEGAGATITYTYPSSSFLQPNSTHTIAVDFSDGTTPQTKQWSFTTANLPVISPAYSLANPPGTNFSVQVNKSPNTGDSTSFPNSFARAERQLANRLVDPGTGMVYTNEASNTPTNYGFYTEWDAINYEQAGNNAGNFTGDKRFPGIPQNPGSYGDDPNYFSIAATIKLSLAGGLYRMGVRSDDGFRVTAGTNSPPTDIPLGLYEGGRGSSETTFDFVVTSSGLYNFRLVYYEGGGSSDCEWYWVNIATGARELVRPLQLVSATSVSGTYTAETQAQIDPGAKTITVPKSGNAKFYRLLSTKAYTLNPLSFSGNNVILTYQ